MFAKSQTVFTFGVCEKAELTVTTPAELILETSLVSTVPSGKTTLNFGEFVVAKSEAFASSIVITVVDETADNLPPLLTPARTGSLISIIAPGLTTAPASIEVVKLTSSDSFCSANNIALPNLAACPLDVQAKALTCFVIIPNLLCAVVSSTISKSTSWLSILKYETATAVCLCFKLLPE